MSLYELIKDIKYRIHPTAEEVQAKNKYFPTLIAEQMRMQKSLGRELNAEEARRVDLAVQEECGVKVLKRNGYVQFLRPRR